MTEPDATPPSATSVPEVRAPDEAASAPPSVPEGPEAPSSDMSAPPLPAQPMAPHAPPSAASVPEVPPPGTPVAHVPSSEKSAPEMPSSTSVPPSTAASAPHVSASATTTPGARPAQRPEPAPPPRHGWAWLAVAAIVVLAVSQAALWVRVLAPPSASGPLDQRVEAIEARVAALERRPVPTAGGQPAPAPVAAAHPVPALGSTGAAPDLGPLEARIAALEQRPAPAPAPNPSDSFAPRLTADETRLATLEKTAEVPAALADRTNRIARIQAAFIALSAGRPLGDLPGAPPALARYAAAAPPTEAALRLSFPAAAQAALAADHPAAGEKPFLQRIWAEAQDLVTIRQGEHVLVGDPAAGLLAHAQTALDAGDLAGAVAAVATLSGPAAQLLAPWLDRARGLLAARAALADLAAQT